MPRHDGNTTKPKKAARRRAFLARQRKATRPNNRSTATRRLAKLVEPAERGDWYQFGPLEETPERRELIERLYAQQQPATSVRAPQG